MKQLLTMFAMLLAIAFTAAAQERQISGKVTSKEDNQTVPGVSIAVKGTTIGTVTDIDGNYKLTVPASAKAIVFSFVGMKTKEVELGASNNIDIVMESDVLKLDEVVVTALGIRQEKKRLSYAVQDVSGSEIAKSGELNAIQGLAGKAAGVTVTQSSGDPGASSYITLRGMRAFSATGDNQPLIVVDGMQIDNTSYKSGNPDEGVNNLPVAGVYNSNRAIDLNPDDIESVTVLKGPAAAALYGLSAGNGVIIITTKKGRATPGKKINVTLSTAYSVDMLNKFPELQTKYSQGSGGNYRPPESLNRNSWGALIDTLYWDGATDYPYDKNGHIIYQYQVPNYPNAKKVVPYDNREDFFVNGSTWTNSIGLSGGNDVSIFNASFSYSDQQGIIPNTTFKRSTLRLAGETAMSSQWKISGSAQYSKSGGNRAQNGSNLSGIMLGLLRTPATFDNTNGSDDAANDESSYILPDGTPRAYRPTIYDNPYWVVNRIPFKDDVNRVISSVTLSYTPNDWLNIIYRPGIDMYSDRRRAGFDIYSGNYPGGQVSYDDHTYKAYNGNIIATANKKLSDKFDGGLVVGNNMSTSYHEQLYSQGDGMTVPNFFDISNTAGVITRTVLERSRSAAFYFDAKLDYKKMLYFNVTGRNEWTTTLPNPTENPFFYPSVNLGFIFTEALKMESNKYLPYGKIRLSWANVGNGAPLYVTQAQRFIPVTVGDGWVTTPVSSPYQSTLLYELYKTAGNPDIKPTNSTSTEFGLELKMFQNRLGIDFTYYNTDTKDGIFAVPIAASSGYQDAIFNAGKINNKGMEILATGTPVKTKNTAWDISVNWSQNKSEVVELIDGVESVLLGGFESPGSRLVVGEPYGVIYGGQWLRDGSGNIVIDDEGSPSTNPNYGFPVLDPEEGAVGDPNPDWVAGIRNTITWKGISLTALLDIRKGGDIWNGTEGALRSIGTSKVTETRGENYVWEGVMGHLDADGNLISSGQTNNITVVLDENWYRLGNGSGFSNSAEQFIQDGGWVRLREIGLSYSLKKEWLKKTPFASVDITLTGRNLWLETDYTGVDPETNLTGTGVYRAHGFEYFNNPNTKSYGFSLRVTM